MDNVKVIKNSKLVLPNGIEFNTPGEVDAYVVGLKQAQANMWNFVDVLIEKAEFAKRKDEK